MEVKKDLIGKKTPSLSQISKKHGVSMAKLRSQLAKGRKIEHEHVKKDAEAAEIARDHLAEFPDYYTRLKKMEKRADKEMKEWDDPIERLHKLNRARILQGAKEGKFWLIRSEGIGMNESQRKELIDKILETTTTAAIGGFNKPFGTAPGDKKDYALGGRNRFSRDMMRKIAKDLCKVR
jgi:hypothetical protein